LPTPTSRGEAYLLGIRLPAAAALLDLAKTLLLLLLLALLVEAAVFGGLTLRALAHLPLEGRTLALVLEHDGSDEALDLGGLVLLLAVLGLELATDDVFTDVVSLVEVEKLADVLCTLGADTAGYFTIGEFGYISVALLYENEVNDGEVTGNDATTDRLALALSLPAGAVAATVLVEQKAYTRGGENTLLHGETLLVVAARNAENVALELITEFVTVDLGGGI
jgi:hypothetical protein